MGMNVGSNKDDDDVMLDVNMTPLIDVMLVLLVISHLNSVTISTLATK